MPYKLVNGQYVWVEPSDNTSVSRPQLQFKTKYKLKPGEQFVTLRGRTMVAKPKNEQVSADNRSTWQKKQDQKTADTKHKQYQAQKDEEAGEKVIGAAFTASMPSTYIGPAFNNNGKSYIENVMSGEGSGDATTNLALDIASPFVLKGLGNSIKYATNINNWHLGNWRAILPRLGEENVLYRQGGLDMLDDAYTRGVVAPQTLEHAQKDAAKERARTGRRFLLTKHFTNDAMFNRKFPFYGNPALFENTSKKGVIVGSLDNPNIEWKHIRHKGHKNIYEPFTNEVQEAPILEFDFYKRAPFNFGWLKQNPRNSKFSVNTSFKPRELSLSEQRLIEAATTPEARQKILDGITRKDYAYAIDNGGIDATYNTFDGFMAPDYAKKRLINEPQVTTSMVVKEGSPTDLAIKRIEDMAGTKVNRKFTFVPREMFYEHHTPSVGGVWKNGKVEMPITDRATPDNINMTLVHEIGSHGTDDIVESLPISKFLDINRTSHVKGGLFKVSDKVSQYYQDLASPYKPHFPSVKNSDKWYEARATKNELQTKYSDPYTLTDDELMEAIDQTNGYGHDYKRIYDMIISPFAKKDYAEAWRKAWKLPVVTGLTVGGFNLNNK